MTNEIVLIAFYVIILIYSIIIHEVMHGFVALKLGDPTAKYANRLNLNPFSHMEPWGSVFVPLFMLVMTNFSFAFGWAKPVPYNPYNLKNQKWGPAIVALGGPGSNIILAIIAAMVARFMPIMASVKDDILGRFFQVLAGSGDFIERWHLLAQAISGSFYNIIFALMIMVIFWNVVLAFFNLIPFPPLDGSKLLFAVFPIKTETMIMLEQYGFVFLLLFVFIFSGPLNYFLSLMLNIFFTLAV
jgi:Zn-dependent protease